MKNDTKINFLLKNLFRGFIYSLIIAAAYLLFNKFFIRTNEELWQGIFYSNPAVIYLIYIGSEVFFGIIPPEFFMLWAYGNNDLVGYILNVAFFAGVSYGAGFLGFMIGRFLRKTVIFKHMGRKFFQRYWPQFKKYGSALIIAAALTPIPWAAISILVGSTEYRLNRFLYVAFFRILRFIVYGFIIFQTHQL
ncbi:hypothetical protein ACE01N_17610 [Saccharicrinis sp. FJH2]|uniref:hypothetical protein n=1 Tax=Saccharicrinis sp. FJH65 TaxID=3344659 RepID=UPI0035F25759